MKKLIFILMLLLLVGCSKRPNINDIVSYIANTNKWLTYTYEVVKTGKQTYHVKYYYSVKDKDKMTEYVVTYDGADYEAEVVKEK